MNIKGLDVGTMFIVSANKIEQDKIEFKTLRNMFISVAPDMIESSEVAQTDLDYLEIKDEDGEVESIAIISEDAFKFANIFGKEVRRPMSKGVISNKDVDALDILTLMLENLTGRGDSTENSICVYSVPAQTVDEDIPPVLYHTRVFDSILSHLGFTPKPLNEAMSIIFSECQSTNYSGISISWGCGLTNVCCSYKGTPIFMFSVSRGGDYIDKCASDSVGIAQTRATSIKEKYLDLMNPTSKNKKEKRALEALTYYYINLIEYVLAVICDQFKKNSDDLNIDEEIPIILSGGTSKPAGFLELFTDRFNKKKDFPYNISEIRQADDPLNAVAKGCLTYGHWLMKDKIQEQKVEDSGTKKKKADKENENTANKD